MDNHEGPFRDEHYLIEEIKNLKNLYDIKIFIDVGFHDAETIIWLSNHFPQVFSIGINRKKYKILKKDFGVYSNIDLYYGNRALKLKKVLKKVNQRCIIYISDRGYGGRLINELEKLKKAIVPPIIIIYSFKIPGKPNPAYDFFPGENIVYSWEKIKFKIDEIYGDNNYDYYYNNQNVDSWKDSIFIIPKN